MWDGVLAGAYTARSYERASRCHAVILDEHGQELGESAACGLSLDKLAGGADVTGEQQCPRCAKRVRDLPAKG